MRAHAFLWSVAVAVTIAAAIWPLLGGEYVYDQFVVGPISWQAENKEVDYQALLVVFIVFLVLMWAQRDSLGRRYVVWPFPVIMWRIGPCSSVRTLKGVLRPRDE